MGQHSVNKSTPIGTIAGSVVGGLVLVLIVIFFLLSRRKHMTTPPQPPQELPECGLYELHDSRDVPELPSDPPDRSLTTGKGTRCFVPK